MLRFICAFLIVWGHMGAPHYELGYAGLNAFLILSVALSTRSSLRHPLGAFLKRRVTRILVPWLLWCGVYLALRAVLQGPASVFQLADPFSLLIGPEIHLWFLPFLMISAPLAFAATHLPHGRVFGTVICISLIPLCLGAYYIERHALLTAPFIQWAFAFPPLVYAIVRASGRTYAPLGILVGTTLGLIWIDQIEPAFYLILAATAFELALRDKWTGPWAQKLGDLSFGIYLTHPFCVVVAAQFLDYETQRVAITLLVFALSVGFSAAITAMPKLVQRLVRHQRRKESHG